MQHYGVHSMESIIFLYKKKQQQNSVARDELFFTYTCTITDILLHNNSERLKNTINFLVGNAVRTIHSNEILSNI